MSDSPAVWGPVADPLPSDSRFREDLQALQEGNLVKAQVPYLNWWIWFGI